MSRLFRWKRTISRASLCVFVFFGQCSLLSAQEQAGRPLLADEKIDLSKKITWQPTPKKAGLYSALLPGAGQLYNRQYWKVPVIYAGVATAGYFFLLNRDKYQTYRRAYIARIDNDPATRDEFEQVYSTGSLQQLQDAYKRFLDLTVLFTAIGYTVQVLDAVAFAHLSNFDVSPDLSLQFQPVILPGGALGVGLVARF